MSCTRLSEFAQLTEPRDMAMFFMRAFVAKSSEFIFSRSFPGFSTSCLRRVGNRSEASVRAASGANDGDSRRVCSHRLHSAAVTHSCDFIGFADYSMDQFGARRPWVS